MKEVKAMTEDERNNELKSIGAWIVDTCQNEKENKKENLQNLLDTMANEKA